jgi:hypothetical protein
MESGFNLEKLHGKSKGIADFKAKANVAGI